MKSNNKMQPQTGSIPDIKFTLSPLVLSGILAAALPLMAGAQARDARSSYSPPMVSRPAMSPPSYSSPSYSSPSFSRPAYTPTVPSFSPSYGSGSSFGSGMRTAPTYTPRPTIETSRELNSNYGNRLNGRIGIGLPMYQQPNQNPQQNNPQNNPTTRPVTPGGSTTSRPQQPGSVSRPQSPGGTTTTQFPNGTATQQPGGGNAPVGTRAGQPTFLMPNTRISRTNPGTINGIIGNPASSYNRFNNSVEARRYHFGVPNHGRYYYGNYGGFNYFPGDLAYYSNYSPYFSFGYTALSPYAFYYGAFPPFITLGSVYASPPQYVYVPYPVYQQDGSYNGYRGDDVDGYYLNRNNAQDGSYRVGENAGKADRGVVKEAPKDAMLESAVADIREAWKTGKVDTLSKHVRKDARIAVYLRGKYQYSMDAGDYLDMTRDAIVATKTTRFELDNIQRKQKDIYTVTGRHAYRDKDDNEHTVFVTYVLEKSDDSYVITQVGSAPEKVEE